MAGLNCCFCIKIHKAFTKILFLDMIRVIFGKYIQLIEIS